MAQEVLYGDQFSIGVEHLGSHGMAQMMTGCPESSLFSVVLHSFLNASNRQGLASIESLLVQEERVGWRWRPPSEIVNQCFCSVITDIDDSVFSPFGIMDDKSLSPEVNGIECELCHFTDPKAAAKHEHEHGPIPGAFQ